MTKGGGGGGSSVWGSITGTITDQIDLPSILSEGIWSYSTNTTIEEPSSGTFRFNNSDLNLATKVAIYKESNQGVSFDPLLGDLTNGSILNFREYSNVGNYCVFTVDNFIDMGDWVEADMEIVGATQFAGNGVDTIIRVLSLSDPNKADKSNVLELDNTAPFTPDADYEPATKKYVDDNGGLGYVLATWGANLQTLGRHPAINSPSNAAEITSLGIMASIPVPAAGTIDTITYYNSTGDNTTEFQIVKNGVVMHTFTCTGPYGAETGINVPIGFAGSVPDNIAIRYSAGTAPSEGLYTAYIK